MGRPTSDENSQAADPGDLAHAKQQLGEAQAHRAQLRAALDAALSNDDDEQEIEQCRQAIRRHAPACEKAKLEVARLRVFELAARRSILRDALQMVEDDLAQTQRDVARSHKRGNTAATRQKHNRITIGIEAAAPTGSAASFSFL